MAYAELHCLTNFSFLRGASHAQELVETAIRRGYKALAITDECSLAGVVRAHAAVKEHAATKEREDTFKLIIGAEFRLEDGLRFVLLATSREGYGNLSELITQGRRNAPKGEYRLSRDHLEAGVPHCLALWLPPAQPQAGDALWLAQRFPGSLWIAVELLARGGDRERLAALREIGRCTELPCVASGDVHMHARGRRALQDTLTAIRLGVPVGKAGLALQASGERHLRPIARLAKIYPQELLDETLRIAGLCDFSLDELKYEYPGEIVPDGKTPPQYLAELTEDGLKHRYPDGVPPTVRENAAKELRLIAELRYEAFFLTVYDIVQYARGQKILCQGRGSAANSVVCYALGITSVDPGRIRLLFGRFLSKERNEPPDIDVDFEHERREEVIQYIYRKYGRQRAALAATVICYRTRSAFRDVGKALGLDAVQLDRIAGSFVWWDHPGERAVRLREAGFDPDSPVIHKLITLTTELSGFPRHLSQHVGGFVISRGPLSQLVPTENAAMEDRTVIQWDKDDLEQLGLLKVDVLALGMLTAIRLALDMVNRRRGSSLAMAEILATEDGDEGKPVYEMLCGADSIGVFQVESRAQMSMLPRLRPRCFYDLVVEVAIVRPGPIQGGMVHPYLRNRGKNPDAIRYPSPELREVLKRTLGVPIFQEQVMEIAMVGAGFSVGEADQLRRAMAAWKKKGGLGPFKDRLVGGMLKKGYDEKFALRIFEQIQGFGEYGFPESHSASFALLVYVSAWLKHYEPAAFTCALLNSQPMGFYAPAQLVQDAQRHGVEVRPVDVLASEWECTLERGTGFGAAWSRDPIAGCDREAEQGGTTPISPNLCAPPGSDPHEWGPSSTARCTPSEWGCDRGSVQMPAAMARVPLPAPGSHLPEEPAGTAPPSAGTLESTSADTLEAGPRAAGRGPGKSMKASPLEPRPAARGPVLQPALRLGLRMVKGLSASGAKRLIEVRSRKRYDSARDLLVAADLSRKDMNVLAAAGALESLAGHRRNAAWLVAGIERPPPLLEAATVAEASICLPAATEGQDILADYASTGLTLRRHPLALLRPRLEKHAFVTASQLRSINPKTRVRVAGLVTCRQHPGTAKGVIFVTLEDETGQINVVVWERLSRSQRRPLLASRLLRVDGTLEREGDVIHLIAEHLTDYSSLIGNLDTSSRDFH